MGDLTENFSIEEFVCSCGCGKDRMDFGTVSRLQQMREVFGPMTITSGCRCEAHNAASGGAAASVHLDGQAADIACAGGAERFLLVELALAAGFKRIGVAKTFVHVDNSTEKTNPVLWTY